LRAGDPHFMRLGSEEDPEAYEVKQRGYWLMRRELATRPSIQGGLFCVEGRLVKDFHELRSGGPATHFTSILPADESSSELLVVRGPWPTGLDEPSVDFLVAARPIMACLVANVLDTERDARQREQLASLADIARAFTHAREVDNVASVVATAAAKASGMDFVSITLFDSAAGGVTERATNLARYTDTEIAAYWRTRSSEAALATARTILEMGEPLLMPDVVGSEVEAVADLREFYERAHIISAAMFPLTWREKLLGLMSFSSATSRLFEADEVEYLQTIVSQVTTTIAGLQLYRELEDARRIQHFLARTDVLTGIPNRRYIEEVLSAEIARAERRAEPLSLVMADLDEFKRVNDTYGHQAGDEALKILASLARASCRSADFVGRWGGDEFLFILPGTDLAGARHVAERFRAGVESTNFSLRFKESVSLTVSAGIAQTGGSSGVAALIGAADAALYEAKDMGRNTIVVAASHFTAA
jgi:diguanylate cyclase (GGDEF)-like protein